MSQSASSSTDEKDANGLISDSPIQVSEDEAERRATESASVDSLDHYAEPAIPNHQTNPINGNGHDHDEEEYSEDEDDSEEEDEEEPALKYERMGAVHELLQKDSASALAISGKLIALGTHGGIVHIIDLNGKRIKSFKPHMASIVDMDFDTTAEFVGTASIDGRVEIHSISGTESYSFDMKRPMRTLALEPNFAKRGTRSFVCGGLAGTLVHHEKGWLGHKETILHSGEGPIWLTRWRGNLISWANDLGIKIYDTVSRMRIIYIDRPPQSPRADLFKCSMNWQDDSTLLIAWADQIKVARVRARPSNSNTAASANIPPLIVEITTVFQLDCMIAGIVFHPTSPEPGSLTSLLIMAYTPPDTSFLNGNEATEDRAQQARKAAERPELRIISRTGEELANDMLSISGFKSWGCNDYCLAEVPSQTGESRCYIVLSPQDLVVVKPRDKRDHINWLVSQKHYEEALVEMEKLGDSGGESINAVEIGQKYLDFLINDGEFSKAAHLCPKVCGQDVKRWEDCIYLFYGKHHLHSIISFVPIDSPRLGPSVYGMILSHYMDHNRQTLLQTIQKWPKDIYDIPAVIVVLLSELDRSPSSSKLVSMTPDTSILMECLAELYVANREPGKALRYYIRLRKPNVFAFIRDNNLFTDAQDQALLLVEFDQELADKKRKEEQVEGLEVDHSEILPSPAICLLVDHTYSIPVVRVVQQLQSRPYFLFLYLYALFEKDPHLASDYADTQVKLYAEYASRRLIDFLRSSNYYNLEKAYNICKDRDLVTEMVFLLGRMGNNKQALTLIIERLGDVNRAIDFAKEQNDDDLWEDLLQYSETRPTFIRGLLENVGAEIDPIRLIRRIKNGLEIPGLKPALIKILQDFNLQISLLEGCKTILNGDCLELVKRLHHDQANGFFLNAKSTCPICSLTLHQNPQGLVILFLCRHVVHAKCVNGGNSLPHQSASAVFEMRMGGGRSLERAIGGKIAFASIVRSRLREGCPVCHRKEEGERT